MDSRENTSNELTETEIAELRQLDQQKIIDKPDIIIEMIEKSQLAKLKWLHQNNILDFNTLRILFSYQYGAENEFSRTSRQSIAFIAFYLSRLEVLNWLSSAGLPSASPDNLIMEIKSVVELIHGCPILLSNMCVDFASHFYTQLSVSGALDALSWEFNQTIAFDNFLGDIYTGDRLVESCLFTREGQTSKYLSDNHTSKREQLLRKLYVDNYDNDTMRREITPYIIILGGFSAFQLFIATARLNNDSHTAMRMCINHLKHNDAEIKRHAHLEIAEALLSNKILLEENANSPLHLFFFDDEVHMKRAMQAFYLIRDLPTDDSAVCQIRELLHERLANRINANTASEWTPKAAACYPFYVLHKNGGLSADLVELCKQRAEEVRQERIAPATPSSPHWATQFQPPAATSPDTSPCLPEIITKQRRISY